MRVDSAFEVIFPRHYSKKGESRCPGSSISNLKGTPFANKRVNVSCHSFWVFIADSSIIILPGKVMLIPDCSLCKNDDKERGISGNV